MITKQQRQLIRRIEAFTKRAPREMPEEDFWQNVHALVCDAEKCKREADNAVAVSEDRNDRIERTIGSQLEEVRTERALHQQRRRKLEDALDSAVKIAKKDRAPAWKKATNADFQAICECESLLVERQAMEKEAEFQAQIADQ